MLDDREVAAEILKDEDPTEAPSEWAPPLSEFDTQAQFLARILDALKRLNASVVAAAGGKPERPKPAPHPRTAVDALREERSRRNQAEIIGLFTTNT